MRLMIYPDFKPQDPDGNALELCDLFMLRSESAVPIFSYVIVSDDVETQFIVGPNKYRSALFLLYLMTKSGTPIFQLTPEMRRLVIPYHGQQLVGDAQTDTGDHTVRALLGNDVQIRLTLMQDYRWHLAPCRSPQEIIEYAWERRADIERQSREPFLRVALPIFFGQLHSGTLSACDVENHWPTPEWIERAHTLENLLKH